MPRCIPNTSYDCPFALGLVVVSFILALGATNPAALYLSFTTGAVGFALKLLTHDQLGLLRELSDKLHPSLDPAIGLAAFSAPVVFGLTGAHAVAYWVLGAAILSLVALHKPHAHLTNT